MKRAGRLMERVIERDNLRLAFWKAARGKRTKRDAALFAARLDGNLEDLARELDEETYAAGPYHQFTIYDPKQRLITAPCFRDRVVHHAIMNVCEPEFDRFLIDDTFLAGEGVTDFDHYRIDPSVPLAPDFFVPDSNKPPPGVSLAAKA